MRNAMRPKISIVIPVYNVEKYIAECLESCVNQTLREIEIIAIDDGSTDKSLNILKQYSKRYEKLRIIEQDNMGVGVARNNGILASKGEFIAFMDPDDFYYSLEVLEKLYLKAKESGVGICGGSLVELREREGIVYSSNNENPFVFSREGSLEYKDYQFDYGYTRFITLLSLSSCIIIT